MLKVQNLLLSALITVSLTISSMAQIDQAPIKPVYLQVDDRTDHINVAGNEMPLIPSFPNVSKKAGYIRGYVKNPLGDPLKGAKLGLKSARLYDSYIAASAETDANGFYEIKIPTGGARFDYAGLVRQIGRGQTAAVGLHPADGDLNESYPAASGGVENFVAFPYGIGDANGAKQNARYRGNYYGGSFLLRYFIAPPGQNPNDFARMVAAGSELIVTLVPVEVVADGKQNVRAFEIRKKVEESSLGEFYICNVPTGEYKITVMQSNGKPLRLKQKNPTNSLFGLDSPEMTGTASLIFNPISSDPKTAVASRGNWADLEIIVERP